MTVKKQFAQDGAPLDDCMESLLEVLAELLEEPENPPVAGTENQGTGEASADLRSGDDRAIHVVVNNQEK
jgi:hypothetical protein